jgi:peroxiredoxin
MLTTYLFAAALALGQPAAGDTSDWLLVPHLGRGQELVYRGSFTEESLDGTARFSRAYRLEARLFVLELTGREADVVCCTQLRLKPARPEAAEPEPCSVRLERARVGPYGQVVPARGLACLVPLEGPPTVEWGAFVEVPAQRLQVGRGWEVGEEGRPPRSWRVDGTEPVGGAVCVRLVGVQQSADWDHPRADRTAWRRRDVVWLAPRTGCAQRLERTIERRAPARQEPTQRSVLRYDLDSNLQYPGQLWEDRRREILLALGLADQLAGLLPRAGEVGPRPFEAILTKIKYHLDLQPPTPFRPALKQLQQRAEAGRRGETPPEAAVEEAEPVTPVIALHAAAPDFVAPNLITRESARLRRLLGKPTLLVFYQPGGRTAADVLRFAQAVQQESGGGVTVVGLACTEDVPAVVREHDELGLTFPILLGTGLKLTYAVEATPKLVVLDAAGVVRDSHIGWGLETPAAIRAELRRWVADGSK